MTTSRSARRRLPLATSLVALALAACAASASANTIAYSDAVTSGNASKGTSSEVQGASCVSPPPFHGSGGFALNYKLYGFQNVSGADSCVTVSSAQLGPNLFSESYVGTFDPTDPSAGWVGDNDAATSYSFSVPDGDTLFTTAEALDKGSTLPFGYTMSWTGDALQPLDVASALAAIDSNNSVDLLAYGAPGGPATGTVLLSGANSQIEGLVQCVRVSGENASVVARVAIAENEPASIHGLVMWLHDGIGLNNDLSGQRNRLLTQYKLNTTYATCPDPALPPNGSFRPLDSGGVSVTGP